MEKRFLREKALFMIIILITAVVYFSYAIKEVSAASNVCCEQTYTDSPAYCVYGSSDNCNPKYQWAAASCEQTSFCKIGCCYDLDEGMCYKSTPAAKCTSVVGGEWYQDTTCEKVTDCKKGCCVLGSECSFTTEQRCAIMTAQYPELDMDFRANVASESACLDICRAAEKGCCKNRDDSCTFENRAGCSAKNGDFYKDQYCSSIAACGCSEHHAKGCNEDDVYWKDSCGNWEDIAVDCDYAKGTLCKKMIDDYGCGTVNCEDTYSDEKNVHDSDMGGFRKNGESWCIYESGTGDFRDRPGTRHYRHMCVNGEEVIESCRDYREEICIQGEVEGYAESQCVHNDIYESPIKQGISTVPRGFPFWQSQGQCSAADQDCTVVWVKKTRYASYKCEQNCFCETQEYFDDVAGYCKSLGDCGADMNIMGEKTTDGLILKQRSRGGPLSDEPSETAWSDWSQYGVFGGMLGLFEKIMEALANVDPSDAQDAVDKYNSYSQYAMYGATIATTVATTVISTAMTAASAGTSSALISSTGFLSLSTLGGVLIFGLIIIIIILIILVVIFGGGKVREYHVIIECKPWVAPSGGKNCEACLDQKKVDELELYDTCTDYKCKSLGLNCEYIPENSGTERVACFDANPNDVNSPKISPWPEALTPGYSLTDFSSGYEITPEVKYYTKLTFGIQTDELSQCKLDDEHTNNYEEMTYYFGDSFYQREHNITLNPLPGQDYEYFVRCQDGSGNANAAEYAIKFSASKAPDLTPPVIEETSIVNYGYVKSGLDNVGLIAYVNEPAQCKWSFNDVPYDEMTEYFACEDEPDDVNIGYDAYACMTALNVTEGDNIYYFRCEDISEKKNQNKESYAFHLTGTKELTISAQSPSGTIYDTNNVVLQLGTSGGAEDGKAICKFSIDQRAYETMIEFFNTDASSHSQPLENLPKGDYKYYTVCRDVAANEANATIEFKIDKDFSPPQVEQLYKDSQVLHVMLNEPSTCEYSNEEFEYGTGTLMTGAGTTHNTASAQVDSYYINCADQYDNSWSKSIIVYL